LLVEGGAAPKDADIIATGTAVCNDQPAYERDWMSNHAPRVYSVGDVAFSGHECPAYLEEQSEYVAAPAPADRIYILRGLGDCASLTFDESQVFDRYSNKSAPMPGDYIAATYHYTGAVPGDWVSGNETYTFIHLVPTNVAEGGTPVGTAATGVVRSQTSSGPNCYDMSKREPHSLEGRLKGVIFPEQPNFTDVRKGDDPVEGYLLQLDTSICIQGDDSGSADPSVQFSEVQVYPQNWDLKIEAAMRSMLGYQVRVELASAQSAMTGHDHRPLVAQVSGIVPMEANATGSVIPRTISPRSVAVDQEQGLGEASTTVRAFYEALSIGSGEAASNLIVPEKRMSGPYASASISKFYGPLPEPLRLVQLKSQGPSEYLVSYHFRKGSRACDGRAIVTTTQRDGLNLISKISPLDGC
jgi:hypothetical protein